MSVAPRTSVAAPDDASGATGSLLRTQVARGLAWSSTAAAVQVLLQLVVLCLLARLISPAAFGIVTTAMIVIAFADVSAQLGVGAALVQRADLEDRHVATAYPLSLAFGVALALGVFATRHLVAEFFHMPDLAAVLVACCLLFPLNALAVVSESLLQRGMAFDVLARIQTFSYALAFLGVAVPLALLGWGLWALVAAYVAQAAVRALAATRAQPLPARWRFETRAARELLAYGGGFTAARLGNYAALQLDNVIISRWLGAAALGVYGRAYQLMVMPAGLVGQVLGRVLFPTLAKLQLDPARARALYSHAIAWVALLILPLSVAVLILAPEIVGLLLGSQWEGVIAPLRILAVGMLFRTSYKISESYANAVGAVYGRAWREAIYALAVVIGSLLGLRWGVTGVAIGVCAAVFVKFLSMSLFAIRALHIGTLAFLRLHRAGAALAAVVALVVLIAAGALRAGDHADGVIVTGAMAPALLVAWAVLARASGRGPGAAVGLAAVHMRVQSTGRP